MNEQRNRTIGYSVLSILKTLTLTVDLDYDGNGLYSAQAKEFPYAIVSGPSRADCKDALSHSLKEWAMNLAADFENWKKGHEQEIPYLLMLLISTEDEIYECLKYEK